MGEAKRRRAEQAQLIYHHTSSLRTNQLWMAGVILPEGKMPAVLHPKLGEIQTDAFLRRAMVDFPPVVWLTRRIEVPNCMLQTGLRFADKETGVERGRSEAGADLSNAIALNRLALGFRIADVSVVPWPEYPGYSTAEGQELNESAREVGDDPDQWFVSEEPIDLLAMAEIRVSRSIARPKLERSDRYLGEVKALIQRCRDTPGAFVPPSWLKPGEARLLATRLGVPVLGG
ncbi:MAG TPA: hypothetical protein VF782_12445 [Allosphingosinicella sp.]|jgi:hypothetical protein